ncbi:type I restriction enzyme specificity protein [Caballeronia fortuita]|uniref:Type I restriction enzyme specificity protein n=1 Tax=Caballeronia fortuita TaxID=1777138 RepID=A0A157Z597_9BURK|nr:restriction endonuclease subunit S [Caballeronia fortuita]SAK40684.1 type I restriction enzyme specificity protein [Caballeronia fortuita]
MSSVSFLDRLLDGVAVEWKALGEVTLPTSNIRWRDASRTYRYIDLTSVSIETKTITETTEITNGNAPSRAQKLVEKDDVIFATTRPAQQRYCLIDDQYSDEIASTGYCVLRANKNEVLPKWILHWVASADFKVYVEENQSGSAYPAISDAKVKEFKIPVPCPENAEKSLEIQAEIVRILDAYTSNATALTAALAAELVGRKKQYKYYRDQLLSFDEGDVEWKALGELAEINTGQKPREIFESATCFDYINAGTSRSGYSAASNCEGDTTTTPSRGQGGIGYVGYQNKPFWLGPLCYKLQSIDKTVLINKYLFYFLQSKSEMLLSLKKEGGVPAVNKSDLVKLQIPVPPLKEQERIVALLDKFDALTNSISEGLPREIAFRRKQYEYYRDLLLGFSRPEDVAA